uniref:EGF like domain multiple 7 n=1 Tax=Capra hircus TaxID=9925 RepID=A0A8C2SCD8_CAPHI
MPSPASGAREAREHLLSSRSEGPRSGTGGSHPWSKELTTPFIPREGPGLMSALPASPRTTATQGARNPGNRLFSDPQLPHPPAACPGCSQPRAPAHTSEGPGVTGQMGPSAESCQPGRPPSLGMALGASHAQHTWAPSGPRVTRWAPAKSAAASGLDPEVPGGSSPSPAPATQPAPAPPQPPARPRPPVCSLTDPVISRQHTQEVRPGRAHPNPDLHGTEHKKPPFLVPGGASLPRGSDPHGPGAGSRGPDRRAASGGASRWRARGGRAHPRPGEAAEPGRRHPTGASYPEQHRSPRGHRDLPGPCPSAPACMTSTHVPAEKAEANPPSSSAAKRGPARPALQAPETLAPGRHGRPPPPRRAAATSVQGMREPPSPDAGCVSSGLPRAPCPSPLCNVYTSPSSPPATGTEPAAPTAICQPPCQNGGSCVQPGRCHCPAGWQGDACQTDVDECSAGGGGCPQRCVNTAGSYWCQCWEGHRPSVDGAVCLPERGAPRVTPDPATGADSEVKEEVQRLQSRVDVLEEKLQLVLAPLHSLASRALEHGLPDPGSLLAHSLQQLDRIDSLSEQISFLEEQLGSCSCKKEV